jgi:nitroimidazol reductase NimA-like FMN-containing flavoprotein (pyridoxamine 5'-phosphate oxidase superfamily)
MLIDTELIDEGLEILTEETCWNLLESADVGRVGVTIGALPAIFPVNYIVMDRCIVFRTAPGSKLTAATAGAVVAFQVDNYQRADRTGWSVLAVGESEVVHDLDVTFEVLAARLEPWADGKRTNIVRVTPGFVSGRRIVHETPPTTPTPTPAPAPPGSTAPDQHPPG